jgi:hypothetical protein
MKLQLFNGLKRIFNFHLAIRKYLLGCCSKESHNRFELQKGQTRQDVHGIEMCMLHGCLWHADRSQLKWDPFF